MTPPRRKRGGERGGALLVVVLMTAAAMSVSTSLIERASLAAGELRARRAVLCARYAALGGLALATPMSGAAAAALVSARADSLDVWLVRMSASWCVLRASASCDGATRTLERTLPDPAACDPVAP
jgi:type II secretory pathway component PulK